MWIPSAVRRGSIVAGEKEPRAFARARQSLPFALPYRLSLLYLNGERFVVGGLLATTEL